MKVTPEIETPDGGLQGAFQPGSVLYQKYDVKRGLRDINGKGVLAGLTADFQCMRHEGGCTARKCPVRAVFPTGDYDIKELTRGFIEDDRYRLRRNYLSFTVRQASE